MKKQLLILFFSIISLGTKAQNWGGGIDQEPFNWGFSFQYIASEYKIIRAANWQQPVPDPNGAPGPASPRLNAMKSPLTAGFGIGFVLNYKLTNNLDLRSTPSIIFNDRIVNYEYDLTGYDVNFIENFPNGKIEQRVSPVMVDLPLGIKLKSERRRDFRAYVLLGAKYSTDLGGNKKPKDEGEIGIKRLLKNKKSYASYEAGLGFDLYFEYFKMSPEIKVSHSFGNVIKREGHPYDTPIEKAILRNFTFSLFFE
ncbi:hypothetical protein D3C87_108720 [compost metagenome]